MAAVNERFDVMVIGFGPVGAVLADWLGQEGLSVAVVERSTEVYPLPRAAHFDHEIMRVFQRLGIVDAVLPHVRVAGAYEFRNAAGDLLMVARRGGEQGVSGWAYSYMFNQPAIERALRAQIAQMPNVSVRLGHSFAGFDPHCDGVTVHIDDERGERRHVEARYLVGCDGAWSPVREALGIGLEDYKFDEPWLVVDTIPHDPLKLPTVNLQICDPARPTTCVLMGPGCHRWEFMLLPGEDADVALADGFVESLLAPWGFDLTIQRKAVYRFHGLIAQQWRAGNVLLAGDAAHQMPPFAGQGMCSGIRDAANLAWKLVAVLKDGARPELLDTYQPERDRSVRDYIELAIEMGRVVCTLDAAVAAQRDARMMAKLATGAEAPPAQVGGPGRAGGLFMPDDPSAAVIFPQFVSADGRRLDDVLGPAAWLIDHHGGSGSSRLRRIAVTDPVLAPFRTDLRTWLQQSGADAVLVRPDRYVFGSGAPADLLDAWNRAVTSGAPQDAVPEVQRA